MNYNAFLEVNKEFQASINLEYDLNRIDKVRSYIPTEQSVKILTVYLKSFYYNTLSQDRATVLIGPYGRGKSHLLLVLSALTSIDCEVVEKEEARQVQFELCDKIARVDEEAGALAKAIVESDIRTLPVIINSNSADINQSFLMALSNALSRAGLDYLLPDTYFDAALAMIKKWETDFPEALKRLEHELRKKKSTIEELKIGLNQFNQKSYRLFCLCYPHIAAGTEFNPLMNMDVVKLYMAVANALKEQTNYSGISIVFDEFSKFLEANLDKSKMMNFKIIQDMAEAATRSKEAQIHFTCVTHKEILDYSSSDSFKTVEGRFKKLRFVSSSEQSYELIANAIIKTSAFRDFVSVNEVAFSNVANISARTSVFNDMEEESFRKKVVIGCFPLAPLSAYALLHVSELVGQNERTLFTFLAQSGPNTLNAFIGTERDGVSWITIEQVYDYFEELFRKEVFNTAVHSVWAKTHSALQQELSAAQCLIVKAIAVINMIGDERFKPVPAHIKAALLMSDEEFERAIRGLLKGHTLSQRDSSELVLLTANGVDVQRSIDQYVRNSLPQINVCDVLRKACDLGFVIPRSYNDRYSMLRCFRNIFLEASTFMAYENAKQLLIDYPYDGLIIYIVGKTIEEKKAAVEKLSSFVDGKQVVLCVSQLSFDCEGLLKQFEAACRLRAQNVDKHFLDELEVLTEDLRKRIESIVMTMYSPSSEYSSFYSCDSLLKISKQVELNHVISSICTNCYSMTPVINNEMVNKNVLNAQNTKARDLVVSWILQHSDDNIIPCMDGFGPEVSVFKSVFKHTGLDRTSLVKDAGMNEVIAIISDFIRSSEKDRSNFNDLYKILLSPPYGIRKGIIPMLIAYAIRQYKENIVLYFKGKEIELSASILNNLNSNPEAYDILVENGTAEKAEYLDILQSLFSQYFDFRTSSSNRIYSIVKSMQNWIRSLPEYTKKYKSYIENGELKTISDTTASVRNELMRFEINSRELLFRRWPECFNNGNSLIECAYTLKTVKEELDHHLQHYKIELIRRLTAMFVHGYQGGLARSIMLWYEQLSNAQKKHVFDANANALLTIAGSLISFDDETLLNRLITAFVSIAIEDWDDILSETFIGEVSDAISRINSFKETPDINQEGHLRITIDGVNIEKTFSSETISPLGKTALNNLQAVFEEYNGSIEPDEQLAILARLIGDIIK